MREALKGLINGWKSIEELYLLDVQLQDDKLLHPFIHQQLTDHHATTSYSKARNFYLNSPSVTTAKKSLKQRVNEHYLQAQQLIQQAKHHTSNHLTPPQLLNKPAQDTTIDQLIKENPHQKQAIKELIYSKTFK